MPRLFLMMFITAMLAGCTRVRPVPLTATATTTPALDGSRIPGVKLPTTPAGVDCTDAERKARAIAEQVAMRYDLPELTEALRVAIARAGTIEGFDVTVLPLEDGWTYHGDGRLWFFRSGAWAMTFENDGAGPIHLCGTDAERQMDACVDVTWEGGRARFSTWRIEEWIILHYFPIEGIDDAPLLPDCNFAIPVGIPPANAAKR